MIFNYYDSRGRIVVQAQLENVNDLNLWHIVSAVRERVGRIIKGLIRL